MAKASRADRRRQTASGVLVCLMAAIAVRDTAQAQTACPVASLPAYSHNDYTNARPLFDAVDLGFRGVEVDLFLVGGTLRVGHDRRAAARRGTFEATYLAPLQSLIARCDRLTVDGAPFLLTIEFKEASPEGLAELRRLLARYRSVFVAEGAHSTRSPVEVVLVGWVPSGPSTDELGTPLFRQHRMTRPDPGFTRGLGADTRLVSLDYGKTMGRWWVGHAQRRHWLAALAAAKRAAPNRLVRVYNVPASHSVYKALLESGVDLIGTKQLKATAEILRLRSES